MKNRLRPYFSGVNLDHIRVHEGIPEYVVGDLLAYAGNRILFKEGKYDQHSVQGLADIGHEITHNPSQSPFDPRPPRYIPVQRPIEYYGVGLYGVWVPGERSRREFRKARYLFFIGPQETAMDIARRKNCATPNSIVEEIS